MNESASLRLPGIFSEHLVLQANRPNQIWGWASAGGEVSVRWQGEVRIAQADAAGKWRLELSAAAPGGPHVLEIFSGSEKIILSDVLLGDVWLCSGQSNMEWTVSVSNNPEKEVPAAQFPQIRLLKVSHVARAEPQEDTGAKWQVCSPETVENFSGVGYFFGRDLHQTQQIPIGLIDSSWGGTPAEAWTEWSFLEKEPAFASICQPYLALFTESSEKQKSKIELISQWRKIERYQDPGNRGYFRGWAEPDFDDAEWKSYQVPGLWQNRGMLFNGAVWFRRKISVPSDWAGRDLILFLGALDDFDDTYINGVQVGSTGKETTTWWLKPRRYRIPASLVEAGKENTIAVRIFDEFGQGGFAGGAQLSLYPEDSNPGAGLNIEGEWKYHVEYALDSQVPERISALLSQSGPNHELAPSNLYNGMIAPLVPFGLKGVIWYQGESNADRAEQYRLLFPRLIESWRASFQNPDLAFLFVLLANWCPVQTEPSEGGWADIREAQLEALNLPQTGYASAIDLGEADDIHPRDKQSVGHRLALSARAVVYGEKLESTGPVFHHAEPEGPRLRVHFTHADGLKTRDGNQLKGFAVRKDENQWYWADASIEGETVVLSHPRLSTIAHVRYAWASNPIGNLANAAGLPAQPFRTDR